MTYQTFNVSINLSSTD